MSRQSRPLFLNLCFGMVLLAEAKAHGPSRTAIYPNGKTGVLAVNAARFGVRFGQVKNNELSVLNPLLHLTTLDIESGDVIQVRQIDSTESMSAIIHSAADWIAKPELTRQKMFLFSGSGERKTIALPEVSKNAAITFDPVEPQLHVLDRLKHTLTTISCDDARVVASRRLPFSSGQILVSPKGDTIVAISGRTVRWTSRASQQQGAFELPSTATEPFCLSLFTAAKCAIGTGDGRVIAGDLETGKITVVANLESSVVTVHQTLTETIAGLYDSTVCIVGDETREILDIQATSEAPVPVTDLKIHGNRLFVNAR